MCRILLIRFLVVCYRLLRGKSALAEKMKAQAADDSLRNAALLRLLHGADRLKYDRGNP